MNLTDDQELIESLGGPAKVSRLLGFPAQGGVQRVNNWLVRGIPSKIKLEYADIFLKKDGFSANAKNV